MRPEVGTQSQFKKKEPPKTYRYDWSLSPELNWDGQNPARQQGGRELSVISGQLSAGQQRLADQRAALERLGQQVAVKVIDDRGNELMVVKWLSEV